VLGIAKRRVQLFNEVGLFNTVPGPPLSLSQDGNQGLGQIARPHIDLDGVIAAAPYRFQAQVAIKEDPLVLRGGHRHHRGELPIAFDRAHQGVQGLGASEAQMGKAGDEAVKFHFYKSIRYGFHGLKDTAKVADFPSRHLFAILLCYS
jgi:hypothetical protein